MYDAVTGHRRRGKACLLFYGDPNSISEKANDGAKRGPSPVGLGRSEAEALAHRDAPRQEDCRGCGGAAPAVRYEL